MSNAKFAAAKELIEEKHYEAARAVLKTIQEPKAQEWLKKLDKIAPDFPETTTRLTTEQEKYYKRENQTAARRRFFNGFELIVFSLFSCAAFAFFSWPRTDLLTGETRIDIGFSWILLIFAVLAFIVGIRRMMGKSR